MTVKKKIIKNQSQKKVGGSADLTHSTSTIKYGDNVNNNNPGNAVNSAQSGPATRQLGSITLNATKAENIVFLTFRQQNSVSNEHTSTWKIRETNITNGNIIHSTLNNGGNITITHTHLNQVVGNVTYYFSVDITATNPQAPSQFKTYLQGLPNGFGTVTDLDDSHQGSVQN